MANRPYQLSFDRRRCITEEALGYACYLMLEDERGENLHGTHQGSVGTLDEAERWLKGDDSVTLLRIWPSETVGG